MDPREMVGYNGGDRDNQRRREVEVSIERVVFYVVLFSRNETR